MTQTFQVPPAPQRITATDALRRGIDSALANWQLILVRVAETVLFAMVAIGAVLAVVVPLLVTAGLSHFEHPDPQRAMAVVAGLIAEHWLITIWILLIGTLLLLVFALVHSFVVAASARIFVDAERRAGRAPASRAQFAAFTADRWADGGRRGWWPLFIIYNLAYGAATLVLFVPLLFVLFLLALLHASMTAMIFSCFVVAFVLFAGAIALIFAGVWSQKAILLVFEKNLDGGAALGEAWRQFRRDPGRHFTVAFVTIVVAIGISGTIGVLSFVVSASGTAMPFAAIFLLPLRLLFSIVQGAFGAAAASWSLASFAALSEKQ